MMRKPRDNSQATAAFMAKKAEIDVMLIRLSDLSADHFDVYPNMIHWVHVGTLENYAGLRERVTDAAVQEGEHAT